MTIHNNTNLNAFVLSKIGEYTESSLHDSRITCSSEKGYVEFIFTVGYKPVAYVGFTYDDREDGGYIALTEDGIPA